MNRLPPRAATGPLEQPIFFDTNVLVYAYDPKDVVRKERALAIIAEAMKGARFVVSAQVMQEFYNVVLRRRLLAPPEALAFLRLLAEHTVVAANAASVLRAFDLQQCCRLSVWDALIVQAALDGHCATLFSEDMQDGQQFVAMGDRAAAVTVVNPFATDAPTHDPAVHEPKATYAVTPRTRATLRRQP